METVTGWSFSCLTLERELVEGSICGNRVGGIFLKTFQMQKNESVTKQQIQAVPGFIGLGGFYVMVLNLMEKNQVLFVSNRTVI